MRRGPLEGRKASRHFASRSNAIRASQASCASRSFSERRTWTRETQARAASGSSSDSSRASDLPEPEVNAWVEGKERDLVWREQRVVVEADSYTFHGDPRTWAKDIGKTNELQLLGYVALRFTWFDVTERPAVGASARSSERWSREANERAKRPPLPGRASRSLPRQVQRALRRRGPAAAGAEIKSDQAPRLARHECHISDGCDRLPCSSVLCMDGILLPARLTAYGLWSKPVERALYGRSDPIPARVAKLRP